MKLRDYQLAAVEAVERAWQADDSTLLVMATGCGKTVVAAHVIDRAPQGRVMFLAHREELIWQAQAKIRAVTGVEPGVEMADYRADSHIWGKHRVIVSSVQTQYSGMDGAGRMSQFDPNEFSVLIADECFPAGTLIDGKPIEDICVGDYVRSYNHSNGRIERQRVARLFCRQSKHLIKLSFTNGRSLVCTPNHPIFSVTRGEYVPAYLLNCQDEVLNDVSYQVHSMRPSIRGNQCPTHMLAGMPNGETNRAPHTTPCTSVRYMRNTCSLYNTHAAGRSEAGQGVLLSRMPAYCAIENIISDYGENQPQVRFWPHEIQQPHEKPFNSCEGIGCYDRSLANPADGQWDRTDLTRGGVIPSAWMGNKCCSKDKDANGVWISHLLQDRRGVQRNDGGNRSGWQFTQAACEASPRSQKGTFLNVTRVAHIEILESRSRSKFRAMPSNCEVFNIEVEQNHNYFANGILVHNCHHYVSSAYKRVIDYYRQNPNLKVLGITATPQRHDKLAMGAIFQSVAFTFDILAGIDHGWLVPIDQQLVTVEKLDLSAIHTVAGDLNQGELSQVLEDEKNLHDIAAPVVQIVGNRKTLIFCASLKQAERVCEIINRLKPESARWVHGGTPKEERRQLFADYANRRFQFLVNVGVATEGFDDPGVEVVVMARPTKSTSLYTQVIGRGTRPLAGLVDQYDDPEDRKIAIAESSKQAVLIIDMVGNSGKHKLITSADILGGKYPEEVIAKAKAKAESQAVDMRQALEEAAEELAKEREEQQRREAAKRAQVKAKATYSTRKVDPFDILDLQPHRDTGWDTGKPLTEKMVEFLEQRGVNTGDLSYAEAGRLINEIKRRYETGECSYKQAKLLKKYGLPTNAKRTEAKEWIDAIAANGWKLPAELDAMREPMEIF